MTTEATVIAGEFTFSTTSRHSRLTASGHANAVTQPYKAHRDSFLATWKQFSDSGTFVRGHLWMGLCWVASCFEISADGGGNHADVR